LIRDRPPSLAENPFYACTPRVDITADLSGLPDLLRLDLVSLSGIQPITKAIAVAAGGDLRDSPSPGEVALHRQRDARFQLIFIVLNLFDLKEVDGKVTGRPYAISLVPATKRGAVTEVGVDWIEKMNLEPSPFHGQAYLDFDPFAGDRGLFGSAVMFRDGGALDRLHPDEIGFVTDGFLLAPIMDGDEPLLPDAKLTGERANARYAKHRAKTYFKPFQDDRPRRVWGLESPIEPTTDAPYGMSDQSDNDRQHPSKCRLKRRPIAVGGSEPCEDEKDNGAWQHEQDPRRKRAAHAVQFQSEIGGELLGFRPRQQHAEVQRGEKRPLFDPAAPFDQLFMNDGNLTRRPSEGGQADL
jgi:hypothetical protein